MDISKITNINAKAFFDQFLINRNINLEFYQQVPEHNLDYRMVDNPNRKSDSPRESIAHQITTDRQYLDAVKSGELNFGIEYDDLKKASKLTKQELLHKLEADTQKLIELLSDEENCDKKITVPWSKVPIGVISMLYGLDSHEVLHTGWNLAIMDHLNIERFPALRETWG